MPQVWSIEQAQWRCKIDEGSAGLLAAHWTPDSRHILTTAEFQLRITLWSLSNKTVSYIKYPKLKSGFDFTSDGAFMALAERRDCKDFVSLFDCEQWKLIRNFPVDTNDLAGLKWSPNDKVLCVWESSLDYRLLLYSIEGQCLAAYSAYENALGIKTVVWSPTGQFLAVGSFDQKLRLLNHITWKPIVECSHPSSIMDQDSVIVYKEIESKFATSGKTKSIAGTVFPIQSKYEPQELPFTVPSVKPNPEKPNPKLGVGLVKFSVDCTYIATRNDNMPNTIWIWDMTKLKLVVILVQSCPVSDFKWDPLQPRLALCTGNNKLYLWSPAGCVSVTVPVDSNFTVDKLVWHSAGSALALVGTTHFCLCYVNNEV